MQVLLTTDSNIEGDQQLRAQVEASVTSALKRFASRITRVEVHLGDENSAGKSGAADKRCVCEARLARHDPITVTHHAPSVDLALSGALDRLERVLGRTVDKLHDHRQRGPRP